MSDTMLGDCGDKPCDDCGQVGATEYKHWGPLTPEGKTGYFDAKCFKARCEDHDKGLAPRPLGEPQNSA